MTDHQRIAALERAVAKLENDAIETMAWLAAADRMACGAAVVACLASPDPMKAVELLNECAIDAAEKPDTDAFATAAHLEMEVMLAKVRDAVIAKVQARRKHD